MGYTLEITDLTGSSFSANSTSYTVDVSEVVNGITVNNAVTSFTVGSTSYPISINYNTVAVPGIQGNVGNTGPQGNTGATGVSITNANVSGDNLVITFSNAASITAGNVRGPQGAQGIQGNVGATGSQGIQGIQGSTGATGSTGPIGPQGNVGATGSQGIQGIQGNVGATGAIGPQGNIGNTGATGTSISNAAVVGSNLRITFSNSSSIWAGTVVGATGAQGTQGNTGNTGANGVSVTNAQIIGSNLQITFSNSSAIWAGNVVGPQGATGATGISGLAMTYSSNLTMADPGHGNFRVNTVSSYAAITQMAFADFYTADYKPWFRSWANATSSIKGTITVSEGDPSTLGQWNITAVNEYGSGSIIYFVANVTYQGGAPGTFAGGETKYINFIRSGDIGSTGSQGIQGNIGPQGNIGNTGLSGDRYSTTSTTNLTIASNGTIYLITANTGLAYTSAQNVIVSYDINNHMHGQVISYNTTTGNLSVDVKNKSGSGNYSLWTVNLDGAVGIAGADGVSISNAAVINGNLQITFSNSSAIWAGNVQGPQGATGAQGNVGTFSGTLTQNLDTNNYSISNSIGNVRINDVTELYGNVVASAGSGPSGSVLKIKNTRTLADAVAAQLSVISLEDRDITLGIMNNAWGSTFGINPGDGYIFSETSFNGGNNKFYFLGYTGINLGTSASATTFYGDGSQLTGLYSNVQVASYLTTNPPTGTYSNVQVASYLTTNPPTGTYSNVQVASYLANTVTIGNITANIGSTFADNGINKSIIRFENTDTRENVASSIAVQGKSSKFMRMGVLNNDPTLVGYGFVPGSNFIEATLGTTSDLWFFNYGNIYTNLGTTINASGIALDGGKQVTIGGQALTSYSNVQVASYLTANPPAGTYGNTQVASYLAGNVTVGNLQGRTGSGHTIGYLEMPQVIAGNVTLALTDSGKHFYDTDTAPTTVTIPVNSSVAFPIGTVISLVNHSIGNLIVEKGSITLYLGGNATSASRTITSYGVATIMKVATDTWFINGTGVV